MLHKHPAEPPHQPLTEAVETPDYYTHPVRRPKGKFVVVPRDSRDGFKGRASWLAGAINGERYSHRVGGYVMSPGQAGRFVALFDGGWDTLDNFHPHQRLQIPEKITKRLEYLRTELKAERISYGELSELQDLAKYITPGDVELLEAAGVPEPAK